MKKLLIAFCLLFILASPGLANEPDDLALEAAKVFTMQVDDGNLRAAFWNSSPLLQLANIEEVWIEQLERNQKVLGKVLDRTLHKARMIDSSAYLPDDDYQVIIFISRTEHKAKAFETMLLHKVNGLWQVCSYQIH